MPGEENGTIMKKSGDKERAALRKMMDDNLRDFVPEFRRDVEHKGESMYFLPCRIQGNAIFRECKGLTVI